MEKTKKPRLRVMGIETMKVRFFVLLLVSDALFQQLVLQNILMQKQCPACRFSQSQIQGRDQNAATEYC